MLAATLCAIIPRAECLRSTTVLAPLSTVVGKRTPTQTKQSGQAVGGAFAPSASSRQIRRFLDASFLVYRGYLINVRLELPDGPMVVLYPPCDCSPGTTCTCQDDENPYGYRDFSGHPAADDDHVNVFLLFDEFDSLKNYLAETSGVEIISELPDDLGLPAVYARLNYNVAKAIGTTPEAHVEGLVMVEPEVDPDEWRHIKSVVGVYQDRYLRVIRDWVAAKDAATEETH